MSAIILPLAIHYIDGGILSLVIPLGVLIVVAIWYVLFLRRGSGEA
jgi:hypothetical protein